MRDNTYQKIFILGNGPSLRGFDFDQLGECATIGMNAAYRHWDRIDWYPTYYCCMDTVVIESHQDEIARLIQHHQKYGIQKFFLRQNFFDFYPELIGHPAIRILEIEKHTVPALAYPRITTGSFSALWAAYLGFSQIYLLGIDMNYVEMVAGAEAKEGIKLEMVDTPDTNPNYFFDDYQQKGDKFNRPNPNPESPVHEHSWLHVKHTLETLGYTIVNCNTKSKLDIFPFASVDDALNAPPTASIDLPRLKDDPRVLVIDTTPIGSLNATGQLKSTLFAEWLPDNVMQLCSSGEGVSIYRRKQYQGVYVDFDDVLARCVRFQPDVIYYRPVPEAENLHLLAMELIVRMNTPLVTHMMDDWIQLLATDTNQGVNVSQSAADIQWLLSRSVRALCISQAMSDAYYQRYGVATHPIANGVAPEQWPVAQTREIGTPFIIRHMGNVLSPHKSRQSVIEIAEIIESINDEIPCYLELYVNKYNHPAVTDLFKPYPHVYVKEVVESDEAYRQLLISADLLVIAYQFDETTINYLRYSFANKMPECLASGTPVLTYGPSELATVQYLKDLGCTVVVDNHDVERLSSALWSIVRSPADYADMARLAQQIVFEKHNLADIRWRFGQILRYAANRQSGRYDMQRRQHYRRQYRMLQHGGIAMIIVAFLLAQLLPEWTPALHVVTVGVFVANYVLGILLYLIVQRAQMAGWVRQNLRSVVIISLNLILSVMLLGISIWSALNVNVSIAPTLVESLLLIVLVVSDATAEHGHYLMDATDRIGRQIARIRRYLTPQRIALILGILTVSAVSTTHLLLDFALIALLLGLASDWEF